LYHCYSGDESSKATQKTASRFSVFSFLDAASHNVALKTSDSSDKPINEMQSVSEIPEVTTKQEPEAEEYNAEDNAHNSVSLEQKSDDSMIEFPDPPAKIDLYKAIFLSSSEDSDDDSEEKDSGSMTKENESKQNVLQGEAEAEGKAVSSDKLLTSVEKNTQRNMSPPRGVFANLDLDAINARKEKPNKVAEKKEEESDVCTNKQATNEEHGHREQHSRLEQLVQDVYGPQLPSVSLPVTTSSTSLPPMRKVLPSVVASVHNEWVEKTKQDSHKNKHNKKHKKSSKHKKHKHKRKRH
jgi:G patch domain-containing protein 1